MSSRYAIQSRSIPGYNKTSTYTYRLIESSMNIVKKDYQNEDDEETIEYKIYIKTLINRFTAKLKQ